MACHHPAPDDLLGVVGAVRELASEEELPPTLWPVFVHVLFVDPSVESSVDPSMDMQHGRVLHASRLLSTNIHRLQHRGLSLLQHMSRTSTGMIVRRVAFRRFLVTGHVFSAVAALLRAEFDCNPMLQIEAASFLADSTHRSLLGLTDAVAGLCRQVRGPHPTLAVLFALYRQLVYMLRQ